MDVSGKIEKELLKEIGMKAKIVTFDIENTANLLWSWQTYGKNWHAVEVFMSWRVLCVGYKWLGKKAEIISIDDYKTYKPFITHTKDGILLRQFDDYQLMVDMRDILDEADIVIGWNSKRFDVKKVQDRMIELGIAPPSPFKQVDVMQEKRKVANSNSYRLDDTGAAWGTGRKVEHEGWELWKKCMEGDPKAWKKMKRYCKQDVVLTEKNYLKLRPWMATHPNLNHYSRDIKACSACGKEHTLIKRGFAPAGQRRRQIYYCTPNRGGCGKYCTGELIPQDPNNALIIVK